MVIRRSSSLWPLIYYLRTNNLMFNYDGSSAWCVWACMCSSSRACGCRQIRQTEVGVSSGGGGRCGLTLSRHKTQIFRSETPHETPGQLWRTSAGYGLIKQTKLRGGGWSCRGQKDTQRGVKWERCKNTLTTLSYLKHKGGTVISDTTKKWKNKGAVSIYEYRFCVENY